MPRLIDANKLRKDVLDLPNCYNGFSDTYDKAMIIDLIDEQPTVDAEPVVHGRDIYMEAKGHCEFKCSVCGAEAGEVAYGDLDGGNFNYCPNCGAKMDEVEE